MTEDPVADQGPPWMADAICRTEGYPTEFFTDLAPVGNVDAAVAVCQRCPVQWECLAFAIEREDRQAAMTGDPPDRAYVYGGYLPDQREWLSLAIAAAHADGTAIDDVAVWLSGVADDVLAL